MIRRALPHLAAMLVLAACFRLALWQLDRADEKQVLIDQWEHAPAASLLPDQRHEDYTRVSARGRFDPSRTILLDNQVRNNHPGVHVFTPFQPEASEHIFLVNRGWQPFERRSGQWPQFDTPEALIEIDGRISPPPRVGLQLGQALPLDPQNWPNLMTYFDIERIQEALGPQVSARVILLDPDHPAHLSGDPWRLINMGPERHVGYAFQWGSIGLAVLTLWIILTVRSLRRR